MERAIAEMEKIKRAEEIYSRRKNSGEESKKENTKNIYKFLFEVLFLINIIIFIIAIQNQKYIFTEEFIKQVNSYNVNIKNKIEEFFVNSDNSKSKTKESKDKTEASEISGESNDVNSASLVENELENEKELSQEEKDILEIKNNYSLISSVNGTKTSGFGERSSTNNKVTKFHTGVDIAASAGTTIISSTVGTVIQVSSSGDYGKHIRIQTGDLVVLYAHCSKICVKEGQNVKQGEKIAEVGSTGNSTGPHLHFELKLHDRLVNPEKIISI